jgi:hypothetical protein
MADLKTQRVVPRVAGLDYGIVALIAGVLVASALIFLTR